MPIDAASLTTAIAPPADVIRRTAGEVLRGGDFRIDRGGGEPKLPLWLVNCAKFMRCGQTA